ncbi:DUF6361 family protein [Bradyrhizobium elkanii]|uniref:DUF6361 family protein n=1 Tax=Bradyrhizobium elkanii TaxID=29448 RepID=UPI001AE4C784|nr:DUF6361 family protein [Bradyrhizobium elkanii]MBP2428851.1 hypothetical protein [Bradyrhizobium elkanii]WLA93600.1 DUF6361 family protein [Bradyrhizobium elkanii]
MSSFGWTYLSRDALRQAERQLSGVGDGVRDEIGFLILHQRYADYFFPGTSVLHTRLRYALFVPWIYLTLYEENGSLVRDRLRRSEISLAGRLNKTSKDDGVIGGHRYPDATSQPPSVSYWGALGTWGILRSQDGRWPSRTYVHGLLQNNHRRALDDDGHAMARTELPFVALPPLPANWPGTGPLDFKLLPREAGFLHARFSELRPANSTQLSMLARLAAGGRVEAKQCWEPGLVELAEGDGPRLRRAGYAASLAAVGRAVYAALVETLREEEDHQPSGMRHREHLPLVLAQHAAAAGRVKLDQLLEDTGPLPKEVVDVIEQTLAWLKAGGNNPMTLRDSYENAECQRKTQRARLSRLFGAPRRIEWNGDEHALAEPLHYRWRQVSRLLHDLWAAA